MDMSVADICAVVADLTAGDFNVGAVNLETHAADGDLEVILGKRQRHIAKAQHILVGRRRW